MQAKSQQEAEEKFFAGGFESLRRQAYNNSLVFKMVKQLEKVYYFVKTRLSQIIDIFVACGIYELNSFV